MLTDYVREIVELSQALGIANRIASLDEANVGEPAYGISQAVSNSTEDPSLFGVNWIAWVCRANEAINGSGDGGGSQSTQ